MTDERYDIIKPLGSRGYAKVSLARSKQTGELVALKASEWDLEC